ncbi:glutamate-5-semialdehyde dehydrogenase [Candidatus Bathyarchaeota archaeon]|nr:glutamate-5-semialdehyde dehydrogenase [Candidatus Bathyarchaeota archaeon]
MAKNIKDMVERQASAAKSAAIDAAILSESTRIEILHAMADAINAGRNSIKEANNHDVNDSREIGLPEPMVDRLILDDRRIDGMINGLREVANLPDKIGHVTAMRKRPNGLLVGKMIVPLGCIAIIYESRPNVTADAAGLCIKSGNTIILRGGSEAINSNREITKIISKAAESAGFPSGGIQFIDTTDRAAVDVLLSLRTYIDVLIPRGGAKFIQKVVENAKVNVIETGAGNCHAYIDKEADLAMAAEIVYNGKVSRPSVCNATKKVLMHVANAHEFLRIIIPRLKKAGVKILAGKKAAKYLPDERAMTEEELYEEFLDMRLGFIVVDSLQSAIKHVNKYSSHHTETIVTNNYKRAMRFINAVDSASLFWNASTRFTDGGEFGMGAEIGISTQKIHARGPMSVQELTTTKFVTLGTGQIRE